MTAAAAGSRPGSNLSEIERAASRLEPYLRRTPLERSDAVSRILGTEVFLKLECLQRTGSFKLRGALNAVMQQPRERSRFGVVTASAGNHGLGLAMGAHLLGLPATVFLPADAPMVKRQRILALGAEVRVVDGSYDVAHQEAIRHADNAGLCYVDPCVDLDVVLGQATVGLEIAREMPDVGSIVVPVGGGGLVGGIGLARRSLDLGAAVMGVQSDATSAMFEAVKAGAPVSIPNLPTLCDGLAGQVDATGLELARTAVDDLLLVSEEAVADAIRHLYLREGLVVEGSGAVGIAAAREGLLSGISGPVVIILTGANIDARRLADIVESDVERR